MRLVVDLDQLLHRNVCVNLRRRETRVAQQLLDVAQVCAAVEQVRRKRMSESVWTDVVHPRADAYVLLHHPADRASSNSRSLVIQKQRSFITLRNWRVEEKLVT